MKTIETEFLQQIYALLEEKKEALCTLIDEKALFRVQGQVQGVREAIEVFSRVLNSFDN